MKVNLMLDAFGDHLHIIGVEWISETNIAIATQSFLRVYDLSKDNFSPIFNIQPFEGSISAFQFAEGKVLVACEDRCFMH